jgi:uncharacterized membrane protein
VWGVVALTLAGGLLRFTFLGQSYWYDEAVTVRLVRSSLYSMLHSIPGSESTPPLYYVLAWVWSRVFGTTEVGLRSLSALIGTAAIPVVAAAGKELFRERVGLLSAALVAASPFLVWYSQEARAYSLYVLLSALSLLLFARAWNSPSQARLGWWAIGSALAIWTHYFALFLVLAEAMFLAGGRKTRRFVRRPLVVLTASTVLLLPLVYHQSHNGQNGWIEEIPLRWRLKDAVASLLGSPPHMWWVAAAVVALTIVTVGFIASPTERQSALLLVGLAGVSVLLPLALAALGRDYWLSRNVIDAWAPLAIVTAAGLATGSVRRWYARVALVAVSLAILSLLSERAFTVVTNPHKRADWKGLARCLGPPQLTRALAINPQYDSVVLKLYRPSIRSPRASDLASELDVISQGVGSFPVPRGFRRASEACSSTISFTRFRARKGLPPPAPRPDWSVVIDG